MRKLNSAALAFMFDAFTPPLFVRLISYAFLRVFTTTAHFVLQSLHPGNWMGSIHRVASFRALLASGQVVSAWFVQRADCLKWFFAYTVNYSFFGSLLVRSLWFETRYRVPPAESPFDWIINCGICGWPRLTRTVCEWGAYLDYPHIYLCLG